MESPVLSLATTAHLSDVCLVTLALAHSPGSAPFTQISSLTRGRRVALAPCSSHHTLRTAMVSSNSASASSGDKKSGPLTCVNVCVCQSHHCKQLSSGLFHNKCSRNKAAILSLQPGPISPQYLALSPLITVMTHTDQAEERDHHNVKYTRLSSFVLRTDPPTIKGEKNTCLMLTHS